MSAYYLLPVIQSIMSFGLALTVFIKGQRQSFVNRLFLILLTSLGIWGVLIFLMRYSPDTEHALLWERLLTPFILLVPTVFYHFSVRYTSSRAPYWLIPGLYTFTFLSFPLAFTGLFVPRMQLLSFGYAPVTGPLLVASVALIQVLSILALLNFNRMRRRSPDPAERSRAAYIMVGIIILDSGGLFDILPAFGLPLYPGFIFGNMIFSILTTVAIFKHNLLDIHIILRTGAVYILTIGFFVLLIFVTFLLISNQVLSSLAGIRSSFSVQRYFCYLLSGHFSKKR